MAKDDKIHIKLEICRDEGSNKLMITTHFDTNAPNFFKDDNGYFWMPTIEEKNLLNEAFELMPANSMTPFPVESIPKPPEKQEIPPPEKEEAPLEKMPSLEKTSESDVFKVTEEEAETESSTAEKKEEEKGFLVKADDEAIEAAIKKHVPAEDDKSIVEADEQTIIEKVLSQKKKGRWSSKGRH